MKICDLCRAETTKLSELEDEYKTTHIKEICDDCLQIMNTAIWDFNSYWANIKLSAKKKWYKRWLDNFTKEKK